MLLFGFEDLAKSPSHPGRTLTCSLPDSVSQSAEITAMSRHACDFFIRLPSPLPPVLEAIFSALGFRGKFPGDAGGSDIPAHPGHAPLEGLLGLPLALLYQDSDILLHGHHAHSSSFPGLWPAANPYAPRAQCGRAPKTHAGLPQAQLALSERGQMLKSPPSMIYKVKSDSTTMQINRQSSGQTVPAEFPAL